MTHDRVMRDASMMCGERAVATDARYALETSIDSWHGEDDDTNRSLWINSCTAQEEAHGEGLGLLAGLIKLVAATARSLANRRHK